MVNPGGRGTWCESGAAVEVAATGDTVMVRSSANPDDPSVTLSCDEWQEFLATAAGGAEATSSGTNPSHGNVASWTAIPSRSPGPRPAPGSTNAASAGVNVKYRNNSSLLISGNDRNCSYCSRENIFSDTQPPPPRRNKPGRT